MSSFMRIPWGLIVIIGLLIYFFLPEKKQEQVQQTESVAIADEVEEVVADRPAPPVQPQPVASIKSQKKVVLQRPKARRGKYSHLDDSFVDFDEQGNRYITQLTQVGKHLVYHGDVLIGDSKDLKKILKDKVVKRGAPQDWPQGRIPYEIDRNLPQYQAIMDAVEYMNTMTNVQFVTRTDETDFVVFTLGESDCYSYAGKIGGQQEIFLTPRCGVREILHEMMHTLGFFHEQTRQDRDQYVEVLWDNVEEVNHLQFKKIPDDFWGVAGRPFDFDSIMLYNSYIFARSRDEPSMLTQAGELIPPVKSLLSAEDIERVNLKYPN